MSRRALNRLLLGITLATTLGETYRRCDAAQIVPKEGVAVSVTTFGAARGRGGRSTLSFDPLHARIVKGEWTTPKAGETVLKPDGSRATWEKVPSKPDGTFEHSSLRGGYLDVVVDSPEERPMILEITGHNMVYVNGEPRVGDVYRYGTVKLPILLKKGANEFLAQGGRGGSVKLLLSEPRAEAYFDLADATLPDAVEPGELLAGVMVVNASAKSRSDLTIRSGGPGNQTTLTPVPRLTPFSTRKVAVRLASLTFDDVQKKDFDLAIVSSADTKTPIDATKLSLRIRRQDQTRKHTFLSEIDGSVQYYALLPANPRADRNPNRKLALILSLHGASVEAIGQADAYSPKTWAHLVAPTNRRPYGFDWEDWGRIDALEVLEIAKKRLDTDPNRTYLTGHSMGGHGAWILGATYPDRFAAIGPSAGWISMRSYAGLRPPEPTEPVRALVNRSANVSDTQALARNYLHHGIYVLHGDKDDNVPVTQARLMKETLSPFHRDLHYFEQPGAGHWWGTEENYGTACVDWPPMLDLFSNRRIPDVEEVREVEFVTMNPGVSSRSRWVEILLQTRMLEPSSVKLAYNPGTRGFTGTTSNVSRLAIDVAHVPLGSLRFDLDGGRLRDVPRPSKGSRVYLERKQDGWAATDAPSLSRKGPHRYGPFKEAFRNRMIFVVGTKGTPEENAWAAAKARFDAETFWYRGNGAVDIVNDSDFDPNADRDRNVILYGRADTHASWKSLIGDGPISAVRGELRVGSRVEKGEDLACLFIRPRPGGDRALVAAVSGTGIVGFRQTDRLSYFVSGVAYPDVVVIGGDSLDAREQTFRGAGFFGDDWTVESGEFAWRGEDQVK